MGRRIKKVDQLFALTMAASNLERMRTWAEVRQLPRRGSESRTTRLEASKRDGSGAGMAKSHTAIFSPQDAFGALGNSAVCQERWRSAFSHGAHP
jgi:hypothetical protein